MLYVVSVDFTYSQFFFCEKQDYLKPTFIFFYLSTAMKQTLMSAGSPQTCVEVVLVSTLLAALNVSALMAMRVDL